MSSTRSLAARIASHHRWGLEEDRSAATKSARDQFLDRFERIVRELFPDMAAAEVAKRAANLRSEYFARLALKSAAARSTKRTAASIKAAVPEVEHDSARTPTF